VISAEVRSRSSKIMRAYKRRVLGCMQHSGGIHGGFKINIEEQMHKNS